MQLFQTIDKTPLRNESQRRFVDQKDVEWLWSWRSVPPLNFRWLIFKVRRSKNKHRLHWTFPNPFRLIQRRPCFCFRSAKTRSIVFSDIAFRGHWALYGMTGWTPSSRSFLAMVGVLKPAPPCYNLRSAHRVFQLIKQVLENLAGVDICWFHHDSQNKSRHHTPYGSYKSVDCLGNIETVSTG